MKEDYCAVSKNWDIVAVAVILRSHVAIKHFARETAEPQLHFPLFYEARRRRRILAAAVSGNATFNPFRYATFAYGTLLLLLFSTRRIINLIQNQSSPLRRRRTSNRCRVWRQHRCCQRAQLFFLSFFPSFKAARGLRQLSDAIIGNGECGVWAERASDLASEMGGRLFPPCRKNLTFKSLRKEWGYKNGEHGKRSLVVGQKEGKEEPFCPEN